MTPQQRYTGPELSALLREVRSELGDQATIHEANRIRTGGIAGFFRKEGFEVLASPPSQRPSTPGEEQRSGRRFGRRRADAAEEAAGAGHLSVSDTIDADDDLIASLTAAMESEQAWVDAIGASSTPTPPTIEKRPVRRFAPEDLAPIDDDFGVIGSSTIVAEHGPLTRGPRHGVNPEPIVTPGQAMLDRADHVSAQERVGQLMNGALGLFDDATLAERTRPIERSVPPRGLMDDPDVGARFPGVLRRVEPTTPSRPSALVGSPPILAQRARVDARVDDRVDARAETSVAPWTPAPTPAAVLAPSARRASDRTRAQQLDTSATGATPVDRSALGPPGDRAGADDSTNDTARFWGDLTRLESLLPIRPATQAKVQLLVGPLDIALPLATRFANDPSIGLSIFTDEIALEGVTADQLAESSRDLHQRLLDRTRANGRGIGVLEADDGRRERGDSLDCMLTPRVLTMIDRIVADGAVDLLRLTLRSLGPITELSDLIDSFDLPCAIDLQSAPTAAELDAALDAGLPIVSIAGRQLTPALAMALKKR